MALKKNEKLKMEIAKELGLLEKVLRDGWKSLRSKETGRIGGMMSKRENPADNVVHQWTHIAAQVTCIRPGIFTNRP